METIVRGTLWCVAVLNVLFGIWAMFWPERVARAVRLEPRTRAAHSELRAMYGGLVIALGLVMIVALRRPDGWVGVEAVGLLFAGLTVGRLASLALDGLTRWSGWLLLAEGGFAVLLLWAAPRLAG